MKTEKRLTMALSVLVALMMLAVPLASSSNLFVDGGQTNSNGDAPLLSEGEPTNATTNAVFKWNKVSDFQIVNTFIIDSVASYNLIKNYYGVTSTGGDARASDNDWEADPWIAIIYTSSATGTNVLDSVSVTNSNIKKDTTVNPSGAFNKVTFDEGKAVIKGDNSFTLSGKNSHSFVISLTTDLGLKPEQFRGDYTVSLNLTAGGVAKTLSDSVTYASPNDVKIIDSWIVYDQKSLDKIGNYVGKDIQNSNFGPTWKGSDAWIAIAYTAPVGVGSVDFTAQLGDNTSNHKTLTAAVGSSNGTHVFTAFIDGNHTKNDGFGLTTNASITSYPNKYFGDYVIQVDDSTASYKFTFGSDATEQITITFNLNVPDSEGRISLDEVKANLTLNTSQTNIIFSYDPDNKNILYATLSKDSSKKYPAISGVLNVINPSKAGYDFVSWTDENGVQYDPKSLPNDKFEKSITMNANWEINEGFVQTPVDVVYDGTTYKYSLAMKVVDGKTVNVSSLNIIDLLPDEINDKGYVINKEASNTRALAAATLDTVYSYTVKENNADGKDLKSTGLVSMNSASSVFIEYSLTSYTKITVQCDIFGDEKAVMYAYNSNNYTYQQVWDALTSVNAADLGLKKAFGANNDNGTIALNVVISDDNKNIIDGKATTADEKYRILNWDSGVALDDTKTAPGVDLKLNVELNGYNVIFMVNGQAQIVNIPYNQLTVDKCPFDVTGVNHWVYQPYDDYKKGNYAFSPFSFNSTSDLKTINNGAKSVEEPQYVFIACFEKADNTAYAVFNASSNGIAGNYGNEYINKIIIPGKAVSGNNSTVIPLPSVSPVYETKNVLIGYVDSNGKAYSSTDKASVYGKTNSVEVFNANAVTYKYTITFDNGTDAKGIFYYSGDSQTETNSIETVALVAFSYNGVAYKLPVGGYDTLTDDAAKKAFNNILYPAKDGYKVTQWKDADGNVMLDKVKKDKDVVSYEVKFKKISSDITFKANFEAKEYYIIYSGNTATMTNNMKQIVKVDENVSLFSDSTFSNDGYKLKEWNTRPDGKGTSYALGSSFSINGAQYEDLETVQASSGDSNYGFTLYAIWEKSSSGSGSSDNNDGNNDNTSIYLLVGILIVIIILILVMIFLMKKN